MLPKVGIGCLQENKVLDKLKVNPDNPRTIGVNAFKKLKNSLKEFLRFLEERPILYDEAGIIWAGNQRFRALKMLVAEGLVEDNPAFYKELKGYTLEEKRRIAILDNSPKGLSGDWDFDILANKWDDLPLEDWGINTTGWKEDFTESNKEIDTNILGKDLDIECPKCHFKFKNRNV